LPLCRLPAPRPNRSLLERETIVGDDLVEIDAENAPETSTIRAGAEGRLVGEKPGARGRKRPGAHGTGEPTPQRLPQRKVLSHKELRLAGSSEGRFEPKGQTVPIERRRAQ